MAIIFETSTINRFDLTNESELTVTVFFRLIDQPHSTVVLCTLPFDVQNDEL